MYQICKATAVTTALVISTTNAFVPTTRTQLPTTTRTNYINNPLQSNNVQPTIQTTSLYATESEDNAQDSEIERLKNMAAKLRAEAASLEADKANQLAEAAEKAFQKFDSNDDGVVSLSELKTGLEKELKVCLYIFVHILCTFFVCISYVRLLTHIFLIYNIGSL